MAEVTETILYHVKDARVFDIFLIRDSSMLKIVENGLSQFAIILEKHEAQQLVDELQSLVNQMPLERI